MEWATSSGQDGKSKGRMSEDAETKAAKKTKKGGKWKFLFNARQMASHRREEPLTARMLLLRDAASRAGLARIKRLWILVYLNYSAKWTLLAASGYM